MRRTMSYKCIVCKESKDRVVGRPLSVVPTKRAIFAAGLFRGNFISPDLAQAITLDGERRIVCWTHYTDSVAEYRRADLSQHAELNATYAALIYDLTNGERFDDKFIAPFVQKEIEKVIAHKFKAQDDVLRPPPAKRTNQIRFTTKVEVEGEEQQLPKPAFLRPPAATGPPPPMVKVFQQKPCYKCSCCQRWEGINKKLRKELKSATCNCSQKGQVTDRAGTSASKERDFTPPASEEQPIGEDQFLLSGSDLKNLNECPEWVEPEEMYVVIKCKSKEQYEEVYNELEKRKEDAFAFGEMALENDLAFFQGTEKPVPTLRERLQAAEDFKTRRQAECRFITKASGEEEDSSQSPGISGGSQALEEIFVKDEPVDEELYTQALASQHSSLAPSPHSAELQTTNEAIMRHDHGGVSAHLLLMDDGEEEEEEEEAEMPMDTTSFQGPDVAGPATNKVHFADMNKEIKQEEEEFPQTSYQPPTPKKAKGEVLKLGYRQMSERCVRDGCMEQVSFKTSSEWSMKCHHAFGHVPELVYECPVCGFSDLMRLSVCRHMKIAHNQGFQPLFHPAAKNKEDNRKLQELILDCFPETRLDTMEYPSQSRNYQPTVRAVMFYYVSIPKEIKEYSAKKNGLESKRTQRSKCAECRAFISKGPLEWKLKCEHALTHSNIAWMTCDHCRERFSSRPAFNEHSYAEHQDRALVEPRTVQQLNELEFNELEKLVYRLFPEDGMENPVLRVPQRPQTKQIFTRRDVGGQRIVQSVRLLDTETMTMKRKAAPEVNMINGSTGGGGTPIILRRTTRKRTILEPHDV